MKNKILIIDFGSQYTQLIARKIRELGVFCEIRSHILNKDSLTLINPKGIILSGSHSSVLKKEGFTISNEIFKLKIPILGICYGMQLITQNLGGRVMKTDKSEYGKVIIKIVSTDNLFKNVENNSVVWASHSDKVIKLPDGFKITSKTDNCEISSMGCDIKKIYGIQFHPEVSHTTIGLKLLDNFLKICECERDWVSENILKECFLKIKNMVGNNKVLVGLSGGVDSLVTALFLKKVIGNNLIPIFINNGLLRENEENEVMEIFSKQNLSVSYIDASEKFLNKLNGVTNPENKRKIIGELFIRIFEKKAREFENVHFLAQGTIYSDVIESAGNKDSNAFVIKSHHNVGGLPEKMDLKIIEPLNNLFKDEVRNLGKDLGLSNNFLNRHPFPGPGLSIRILGEVKKEYLNILRKADKIFIDELKKERFYEKVSQAFCVFLPIKSVGVMGDGRTYSYVICLRCVESSDFMTASWSKLSYSFLEKVSERIINEVDEVSRVVYDISTKPPATIEWE